MKCTIKQALNKMRSKCKKNLLIVAGVISVYYYKTLSPGC